MRDRQKFEQFVLENGIAAYRYADDSLYTHITVMIPVGTAHNHEPMVPGALHFLEHMVGQRSTRFPELRSFEQWCGKRGGICDAYIDAFWTVYTLKMPRRNAAEAEAGFYSHIFEPLLAAEDIEPQRGIIANERSQKERWYPGRDEMGHYLQTAWKHATIVPLRRVLGFNEDLQLITADHLADAHTHYFHPGIKILIGGSSGAEQFLRLMSDLTVSNNSLTPRWDPIRWVRPQYHEAPFRDIVNPELIYGGIMDPMPDVFTALAMKFIPIYLTNHVQGPLYQWLREEKGWTYSLSSSHRIVGAQILDWDLEIPLNAMDQVRQVRGELDERIFAALNDVQAVSDEVDRFRDCIEAFGFSSLEAIMAAALKTITYFDRILTEQQRGEILERCRSCAELVRVWQQCTSSQRTGSVCLVPE